jgi:hypothetical protein
MRTRELLTAAFATGLGAAASHASSSVKLRREALAVMKGARWAPLGG